jgi:hypothetical protein
VLSEMVKEHITDKQTLGKLARVKFCDYMDKLDVVESVLRDAPSLLVSKHPPRNMGPVPARAGGGESGGGGRPAGAPGSLGEHAQRSMKRSRPSDDDDRGDPHAAADSSAVEEAVSAPAPPVNAERPAEAAAER